MVLKNLHEVRFDRYLVLRGISPIPSNPGAANEQMRKKLGSVFLRSDDRNSRKLACMHSSSVLIAAILTRVRSFKRCFLKTS